MAWDTSLNTIALETNSGSYYAIFDDFDSQVFSGFSGGEYVGLMLYCLSNPSEFAIIFEVLIDGKLYPCELQGYGGDWQLVVANQTVTTSITPIVGRWFVLGVGPHDSQKVFARVDDIDYPVSTAASSGGSNYLDIYGVDSGFFLDAMHTSTSSGGTLVWDGTANGWSGDVTSSSAHCYGETGPHEALGVPLSIGSDITGNHRANGIIGFVQVGNRAMTANERTRWFNRATEPRMSEAAAVFFDLETDLASYSRSPVDVTPVVDDEFNFGDQDVDVKSMVAYISIYQEGSYNDTFYLDNVGLWVDTIFWEFSNDDGQSWYPLYEVINTANGRMVLPNKADVIKVRATGYRTKDWVHSFALKPIL